MSIIENIDYSINAYFSNRLENLDCDDNVRAYIVSVLGKFKGTSGDYSNESITIIYAEAKYRQDFYMFQNIGDYVFYINSLFPERFNNISQDLYCSVGRLSYYSCYKLINRQWKLYEILADTLPTLSSETRKILTEDLKRY